MSALPQIDTLPIDEIDDARALHWLMPLHYFYERRQVKLPDFDFKNGAEMPELEGKLLVHDLDMTPTLATFHDSDLRLEILDKEQSDDYLLRIVILRRRDNLLPVECGAIGITLTDFAPEARKLIEEGRIPLGGVLQEQKISHQGRPRGFFEVEADEIIANALGENVGTTLFGRCNELSFPDGIAFADVVEILPKMSD